MTARRPPRRIRPRPVLGALAVAVLATACGFDPSAGSADSPDDLPGDPDASPVEPVDGSPGTCAASIRTQMLVGGQSPLDGGGDPLVTVILGDTIVMSAAGSCSNRGELSYEWEVGEVLAATADPGTDREGLTVYPTAPGDFPVTLTVSDEVGSDEPITVNVRVLPWVPVAVGGLEVRDVAVGGGRIWIASNNGPQYVDLSNPGAGVQDLDAEADGEDLPADLSAVFFDRDDDLVWFGRRGQDDGVWRLDVDAFAIARIAFPGSMGQAAVRDISTQGAGVVVATDKGVTIAADNQTFADPIDPDDRDAVGDNQAGGWAGSDELVRLSDQQTFRPFGAGDNRILTIAGDDDRLWVGGDDKGVARLNADLSVDIFLLAQGLPSNRVRGLAVDGEHDLWAATQEGVARYKTDRRVWVAMGEESGLGDVTDLLSASTTVDGGRTVVVVAGPDGIAVLGP